MGLEEEFTQALEGTIEAAKKRGYVPSYFIQMLHEHGGKETAMRLLKKTEPQTGLFELWELGLLHESMEAVLCDNPRFHELVEKKHLVEAQRRLDELGYFKKGK